MNKYQLLEDSTESVETYPPPQFLGLPSSAQVRVHTPSTPLPDNDTWDSATVESLTTVTSGAHAKGVDELTFASDPGFTPGRKYLVLSLDGSFYIVPRNTGTTVQLEDPIPVALVGTTSIIGVHMSHALTAAETATRGEGFVLWQATIGGVVRQWAEYLEIVRTMLQIPLTIEQMTKAWPGFPESLEPEDPTGSETIEAAWTYEVLREVRKRGIHEELIINSEPLSDPLIEAVRYRSIRDSFKSDEVAQDLALKSLQRAYSRCFASSDWYAAETREEEQPAKPPAKRPTRRVRMVR